MRKLFDEIAALNGQSRQALMSKFDQAAGLLLDRLMLATCVPFHGSKNRSVER